jgi:hypothetical protein
MLRVGNRAIRCSSRFKRHGDAGIRTKLVAIYGRECDTAEPLSSLLTLPR